VAIYDEHMLLGRGRETLTKQQVKVVHGRMKQTVAFALGLEAGVKLKVGKVVL
jgi:hypothetical protein